MGHPYQPIVNEQPLGYVAALDGLRAVSVIAVIAYHAGLDAVPGGFLGVEVFFVISGFLITTLLIEEKSSTGTVSLHGFWLRRFRRLMPALFAMLAVTLLVVTFASTTSAPEFRRDVIAGIAYASNWWQIFGVDTPYFGTGSLPVLRHLWSLAVEEQWYLAWPLVFVACTGQSKFRRVPLGVVALVASVGIMVAMGLAFVPDDEARTNLLYLGTHTRSSGIILGAAFALLRPIASTNSSDRRFLDGALTCAAAASLGAIGVLASILHVEDAALYRGGLAATSIASVIVVAVVVRSGDGLIAQLLSIPWLVAIGKRSYGLYLWHWPTFVVVDARSSDARLFLALAITVVVNELTYRAIEVPVRNGVIGKWFTERRSLSGVRRRLPVAAVSVLAAIVVASSVKLTGIEARDVSVDSGNTDVVFVAPTTAPIVPDSAVSTTSTTVAVLPRRVVIVGDSQAHSLYVNRPAGIEETFTLTNGSLDGCGVYDRGVGVGGKNDRFRRNFANCAGFEEKWATSATNARADVALIVIGAWEVLDLEVGKLRFKVDTIPADTLFVSQLKKGIDALRATRTAVAVLEVPCMRPVDSKGGPVPALKERGDDARTGHLNDLIREVVESYPSQVTFVEGPTEWCSNPKVSTSLSYRWDGVHVYKPGAKLIFETIADDLLSIPVRFRK
ncbi:MAG: acyltransferase family protein [Actinomycetota bacterium]